MPKAEELLPLPLPVSTSSKPFSWFACSIAASITAFLRTIRAVWRVLLSSEAI
jgi:hypothetical protein